MQPLSCTNCCHNPLQLGPIGTSLGFCTVHRRTLLAPHTTTCGQLLRKDLLRESAVRERILHRDRYGSGRVWMLTEPRRSAEAAGHAEAPNGNLGGHRVVEEVLDYGLQESNVATLAALRQMPGARAEVAMLSLSRGYFETCFRRSRRWTAGVHLFWWTTQRLTTEPDLGAADLYGPVTSPLDRFLDIARWLVVAMRVALLTDVAVAAAHGDDPVGELSDLATRAALETKAGSTSSLLGWLRRRAPYIADALPRERYEQISRRLHRPRS